MRSVTERAFDTHLCPLSQLALTAPPGWEPLNNTRNYSRKQSFTIIEKPPISISGFSALWKKSDEEFFCEDISQGAAKSDNDQGNAKQFKADQGIDGPEIKFQGERDTK